MKKSEFKQIIRECINEVLDEQETNEILGFGAGSEKDFLKTLAKTTNKVVANAKKAEYDSYKQKAASGDELAKKIIAGINKTVNKNDDLFYTIDKNTGDVTHTKSYGMKK